MAGEAEGFDLTDPDRLLRGWELDLLLQCCLWFYFTLTPRKEGAMVKPSPGGSASFHPALHAQFSKALKLVLIIKFVLKGFAELGPLLKK